jgi:CBS domain-containing protein
MEKTRVRDVMTTPVITVAPSLSVPAAMALMRQYRIRHLPVVENERLVGIISRGDLREASSKEAINADTYEINFMLSRLTVGNLMARKVITVTPDAFIVYAAELMTENKVAGLPVVDMAGKAIGIITESDLLRLLVRKMKEIDAGEPATAPA